MSERADLIKRIRAGRCGGTYLRGADLRGADLRGANLGGAYLRGADLGGADLRGAYWSKTRLHPSGTWSERPASCLAGDWHAQVLAPQIVRIGCTELTIEQWLGDTGERLSDRKQVTPHDRWLLRTWLEGLASRDAWPGWEADAP